MCVQNVLTCNQNHNVSKNFVNFRFGFAPLSYVVYLIRETALLPLQHTHRAYV